MNNVRGMKGFQSVPAPQRFAGFVSRDMECWLWTGATDGRYGLFWFNGRQHKAHRVAWMLQHGSESIPNGMLVCHRCDVPLCVRVDHLFLGAMSDNLNDCVQKGRHNSQIYPKATHCARGHEYAVHGKRYGKGRRFCYKCNSDRQKSYRVRPRPTAVGAP